MCGLIRPYILYLVNLFIPPNEVPLLFIWWAHNMRRLVVIARSGSCWWLVVVSGSSWLWVVVSGCGWLWLAVVGCGWFYLIVVGCGWL